MVLWSVYRCTCAGVWLHLLTLNQNQKMCCCCYDIITFRLRHHHSEELNRSVDVTEPAAVKLEEDGGLGDHSGPVTDPGTEGGDRRTWRSHVRMFEKVVICLLNFSRADEERTAHVTVNNVFTIFC